MNQTQQHMAVKNPCPSFWSQNPSTSKQQIPGKEKENEFDDLFDDDEEEDNDLNGLFKND